KEAPILCFLTGRVVGLMRLNCQGVAVVKVEGQKPRLGQVRLPKPCAECTQAPQILSVIIGAYKPGTGTPVPNAAYMKRVLAHLAFVTMAIESHHGFPELEPRDVPRPTRTPHRHLAQGPERCENGVSRTFWHEA